MESYLRCFASDHPKSWSHWISWAEFWYNTTFHSSIGQTPFEVVYGRQAPPIVKFLSNETKVAAVALELSERDEALRQLRGHLQKAQEQMAIYANKKRRDLSFAVGEWVFLKLRPHRQHSVVKRINQKLAARFYGPFQIEAKVGAVAYRLKLPAESKIHPVFHISLLKKAVGNYQVQGQLPADLGVDDTTDIYPEVIVGTRTVRLGDSEVHQSLVKWKHKSMEEVTWEDNVVLAGQFPEFCLEDKAVPMEGGIDRNLNEEVGLVVNASVGQEENRPKVWQVYRRKRGKAAEVALAQQN